MDKFLLTIKGKDREVLLNFVKDHKCEIAGSFIHKLDSVSVDVLIDESNLQDLESKNESEVKTYKESVHLNFFADGFDIPVTGEINSVTYENKGSVIKISENAQNNVSKGTTFFRRESDDKYYSVEEIEDGLVRLSELYPEFTELINLPFCTHENRLCRALKLSKKNGMQKTGVLIVAGTHGDEWVPPDAIMNFLIVFLKALKEKAGIKIGNFFFSYVKLLRIFKTLDIYLFPQVNPDGRKFSHTAKDQYGWRKNKRINDMNNPDIDILKGVDINRNYDFLWNYSYYFDPAAKTGAMDCLMTKRNYIGPCSMSEPETKNVSSLMDISDNVKYFIDIHSGDDRQISFNWTNDDLQFSDKNMSFMNPVYSQNKVMGVPGDPYREYVRKKDHLLRFHLADKMSEAAYKANGYNYEISSSWDGYVMTGCSACYFDSLKYKKYNKNSKHGFNIECGSEKTPSKSERKNILEEITALLLEFCFYVSTDEFV